MLFFRGRQTEHACFEDMFVLRTEFAGERGDSVQTPRAGISRLFHLSTRGPNQK
ncbi:hypothetical protein CCP2SC5_150041 [Azospirillaceae bacterium]